MSDTAVISQHTGSPTASREVGIPKGRGERRLISPFRCRVWTQHSRLEEQLTEYACKALRDSIAKHGQHQPALGRPVTDDPNYEVEIICGARRHAAALALGRDLLVEVRLLSDAEGYVAMYEENAQRKEDCPYVQGQILRRALQSGTCSCQEELTSAFGLSRSKVSRLLMIAQLPSVIVAAFQSPADIRERWGVELFQLWKSKDPDHSIATRARALAQKELRPPPHIVYSSLINVADANRVKRQIRRNVPVRGSNGTILFHEQDDVSNVIFTVPKTILGSKRRHALEQAMALILDAGTAQATPNRRNR